MELYRTIDKDSKRFKGIFPNEITCKAKDRMW